MRNGPAAEPIVEARAVKKVYDQGDGRRIEVIAPIDLAIYPDSIIALLGPSGSGKSTLLRMLAGLVPPTAGKVLWHSRPLNGQLPNVAIVFQSFALFPWLTVLAHVEAPLKARGLSAIERHNRALIILDTVGLDGFETAYPKELSGGMKQRLGFARALVVEPEVLFMDEPFSALDVLSAESLRSELLELWLDRKMPTRAIFIVTHNIEEAVLLADRIIVLGRNPAHIHADFQVDLTHPRDRKSARFLELVDHTYKMLTEPKLKDSSSLESSRAHNGERTKAMTDRAAGNYQMLPHARPGGIAGLLEILTDRGGRDDLYHLADDLAMEAGDLLPIIEAATLLDFIHLEEGDAEITPTGHAFAVADILTRKMLFREAALQHVTLLRQIEHALRAKADRALPDEFFRDILDEHLGEEQAQRQLNTAIHWGRYGEIFDYDSVSGKLFLTEL